MATVTLWSDAEAEAEPRVRAVFADIRATRGSDFINNFWRGLANDPALLTWVHVAEVDSFLRAYVRYREPGLSGADQDRYLAETATIARRLGAQDVPVSRRDVDAYYRSIRPRLRFDERTHEVAEALLASGPDMLTTGALAIIAPAAIDLLPPRAAELHGKTPPAFGRPAIRLGARGMSQALRWALRR